MVLGRPTSRRVRFGVHGERVDTRKGVSRTWRKVLIVVAGMFACAADYHAGGTG